MERDLLFDGQALLDKLEAAKLAGWTNDRPQSTYQFRSNEQAASAAWDVAEDSGNG